MKRRRPTSADEDCDLSVYDGARCLGFIRERGGTRTATTADGKSLGTFPTRKAAADALTNRTAR
jgi:hypothetical protein